MPSQLALRMTSTPVPLQEARQADRARLAVSRDPLLEGLEPACCGPEGSAGVFHSYQVLRPLP